MRAEGYVNTVYTGTRKTQRAMTQRAEQGTRMNIAGGRRQFIQLCPKNTMSTAIGTLLSSNVDYIRIKGARYSGHSYTDCLGC